MIQCLIRLTPANECKVSSMITLGITKKRKIRLKKNYNPPSSMTSSVNLASDVPLLPFFAKETNIYDFPLSTS